MIRWAYYEAAAIHGYSITRADQQWTVTGQIVDADPFKLSQRPLLLVVPFTGGAWTWPILDPPASRGPFTSRLGPPDKGA